MDSRLESLRQAILGIDEAAALQATQELIDSGTDPRVILETGLTAALLELGRLWTCGDVFLPEVVAASAIFEQCSRLVEPVLEATSEPRLTQRFVLATVEGDLHDLGKNIVGAMMKTIGLEVHDLGKNVPAQRIVEAVRDLEPDFVALSALLTTTMPQQVAVLRALEDAGLRGGVKVLVGGAPVTAEWAERIGADGYAPNAPEAVQAVLDLVGSDRQPEA